jgi:hypothetical protein|nr:MAG TPA: hypothetical protein [Caudoviricetes sp.]
MGFAHYVNCIHLSIVVELRRKDVLGVEIALNVIAIMGFLLSVYNFALELYKRHKRITIEIKHVFRIADVEDILHLQIINQSSTSICISRLKLTCDGKSVYYGDYRKLITEVTKRTGQTITCRETWHSNTFPQKIESGGAFLGLLLPSDSGLYFACGKTVQMVLYTDKGKIKKEMTFSDFSSLELLPKCRVPD